jgi:hypothetical protein
MLLERQGFSALNDDIEALVSIMLYLLARDGVVALGDTTEASRVLVSTSREFSGVSLRLRPRKIDRATIRIDEVTEPVSERLRFEMTNGIVESRVSLKDMLAAIEADYKFVLGSRLN